MARSQSLSVLAAASAVALATALPAVAGDTDTTVTLTSSGALSISVPSGDFATAANDLTASQSTTDLRLDSVTVDHGGFGSVTVTDEDGAGAGWAVAISATTFCVDDDADATNGAICTGAVAAEKIVPGEIVYTSHDATDSTTYQLTGGTGVAPTPTTGTMDLIADLTYTSLANSVFSFEPKLVFGSVSDNVAGTYYGTITHSVSSL